MNKDTLEKIDQFAADVAGQAEARAEAARQLQGIARQYPDLVEELARFLENEEEDQGCPKEPPTQAVLAYIKANPGSTAKKIVAALINRIETSSPKPRTIIYSTLNSLEKRHKIRSETRKDEKAYFLKV